MVRDYSTVTSGHQEALDERSEWESEWRQISNHLLPGRGIYQTYAKPQKRKLTNSNIINPIAADSLNVLTSGMHGGLTSPSRPWFDLRWADERLQSFEPLKAWLQDCTDKMHVAFHASNFYAVVNSFYTEYAGFGTGSIYVGEDTFSSTVPFRFELLTAGEYAFTLGIDGKPDSYYRTIFMSPRQMVEKFESSVSKEVRKKVKANEAGVDTIDVSVLECVYRAPIVDKPYTQVYYEITSVGQHAKWRDDNKSPLGVGGFYEFPYPTARWDVIGSDSYGVGPGSRALPDVKRLQEMEKSFLMAVHKSINPPLNAPARMKGKLNTLPGGYNYYSNPSETVSQIYQVQFDYAGVGSAVERVEQRIQRNFFNDIFLTTARDPNASPLRTGQVQVQEQEKMLRLGPVIERLQVEFLQPIIERCFNIMMRKEMFAPLDPGLAEMAGEFKIHLVSPLATAQRMVAMSGIQSFLSFVGQAAQFDQGVLDNVDVDKATREVADISGVQLGILKPQEEVDALRQQRAQAQAAQQQKMEGQQDAMVQQQLDESQANTMKTQAEAGAILTETQGNALEMGIM